MKHVVGYSGGAASAVTAKIVADENPKETILLFHDTKTELADNDRFRAEVAEYIGLPITEDSDGRDIWEIFRDEGYLGNGRNTMCSRILKQKRSMAFMVNNQPAILYIGFTTEEWKRAQRTYARYYAKGVKCKFPLIEQNIGKAECLHRVSNCWGIALPKQYADDFDHANCIPCVKGKLAYWGLIHIFYPEAWERAAKAEEEFEATIFTEAGNLREELEHCLRLALEYLAKKDFQKRQIDMFEFPCECTV